MSRIYRWNSQLKPSLVGPIVNGASVHLQQSDIDGACGPHCALMALMILGVISRKELDDLHESKSKPLAKLWKRTSALYFSGTTSQQLKSLLEPYAEEVVCKIVSRIKNRIEDAIETIQSDGVCIVAISNKYFSHWILAIGTGGNEGNKQAEKFLIIDPDSPTIPLLAWNGLLSVKKNRSGKHRFETINGSSIVEVDAVLSLIPCLSRLDFEIDLEN